MSTDIMDGRCGFYVKRKHRYCKMMPAKGNRYCAEHLSEDKEYKGDLARVNCPLDPKHSVFKHKLEKHLKKCNAVWKTEQPYYKEGINAGLISYEYPKEETLPLTDTPEEEIMSLIERLKVFYSSVKKDIKDHFEEHPVLNEEIKKEEYGPETKKHLRQQASLLSLLENNGAFADESCIIEFGAGRGKLMHWVQKAMPATANASFYLIDKQNKRHKYDCYHKGKDQGAPFHRLYIDIKDLHMGKVENLNGHRQIVGLGKHLCGAATDYSLRCLLYNSDLSVINKTNCPPEKKLKTEINGNKSQMKPDLILIALCCHHRCSWASYTGKDFFLKHGFSSLDFHRLTALTSWALCGFGKRAHEDSENISGGDKPDSEEEESTGNDPKRFGIRLLTKTEKEEIGWIAKRLIDYGRLDYVNSFGYFSKLMYYVPRNVTPENVVLLCKRE